MDAKPTLFIDLDDTLYPRDNGVWHAISGRIQDFLIQRIGLAPDEADRLRASYLTQFGTTLNGLRTHYDIDPFEYLTFVHDVPLETMLQPDAVLREVLTGISMRKVIFTNSSSQHAQRVLTLLGVDDLVELVIDIVRLDFINKPDPAAYQRALVLSGNPDPQECVMVDDRPGNLHPAGALGLTTILIGSVPDGQGIDFCLPTIHDLPLVLKQVEPE